MGITIITGDNRSGKTWYLNNQEGYRIDPNIKGHIPSANVIKMRDRAMEAVNLASSNKEALSGYIDVILGTLEWTAFNGLYTEMTGHIIIDRVEGNLHPSCQRELLGLFQRLLPNIHFIVSTLSPMIIMGAPKDTILLKAIKDEEGYRVERLSNLEPAIKDWTPLIVLTSGIFDVERILHDDYTDIRTERTYKDVVVNDEMRELLRETSKRLKSNQ
jgi:hypothetical protein